MPCTSPLKGYRHVVDGTITFRETGDNRPITLPCGQCMDCRLTKSREWAMRCVHEAQEHKKNSFITLTYDDEHLPRDGALDRSHLTKFFKRLRHHMGPFRYYACGEYGDTTKRAHYHACIFGHNFAHDRIPFGRSANNAPTYVSQTLTTIWGMGHCVIGELNFETAAYTARYVTKKQTGPGAVLHTNIDFTTGEMREVQSPYAVMSKRPAVGLIWLLRHFKEMEKGYMYSNGHKVAPPKYYQRIYGEINPTIAEETKYQRTKNAPSFDDNELKTRATITRAKTLSKRKI